MQKRKKSKLFFMKKGFPKSLLPSIVKYIQHLQRVLYVHHHTLFQKGRCAMHYIQYKTNLGIFGFYYNNKCMVMKRLHIVHEIVICHSGWHLVMVGSLIPNSDMPLWLAFGNGW